MKIWRGQASTLEEAVWQGLKELGLPREKVEVKVLEDRASGLLSMMAFRRVRVELREKEGPSSGSRPRGGEDRRAPQDRNQRRREGRDNGRPRRDGSQAAPETGRPSHQPRGDRPPSQEGRGRQRGNRFSPGNRPQREPSRTASRPTGPAPRPEAASPDAPRPENRPPARTLPPLEPEALLNEWKGLLGWEDLTWTVAPGEGQRRLVTLRAAEAARLTAGNGGGLDAFEHMFNLVMQRHGSDVRFAFEVEGAVNPRKQEVAEQARAAAEEVRRTGLLYRLDPMEPADRRLVHQTLADDPDVETASEGEGPWRKVVVRPKIKKP